MIGCSSNGKIISHDIYLDSESFQEFRQEIFQKELLPNLENPNLQIQAIASESLAEFSSEIILSAINPIYSYSFSKKDRKLLEVLLLAESMDMGRGLLKGNQVNEDGDAGIETKRLLSFKMSIINSVKNEIKAGRMKSTRKIALSYLYLVDSNCAQDQNILAGKEISAVIKNMNLDSIWQIWNITDYLESFWLHYLGKLYDNLDLPNHAEKVSKIESTMSFTYSIIVGEALQHSSSPQITSNLLYSLGSLFTAAYKLGIMGAYNQGVTLFDALYNDLKNNSAKIIPEDFTTSRDVHIAALTVMTGISSTFISHDIYRKADLVKLIFLLDEGYFFVLNCSPGFKRNFAYYFLPKILAEIAELEGITARLNELWRLAVSNIKNSRDAIVPFLTGFRTHISLDLIDGALMHEIFEIGQHNQYGLFITQSYQKSLTLGAIKEYLKQQMSEKESDEYTHMMWLSISRCNTVEDFENIRLSIQDTLKSKTSSAQAIAALVLVAIPINEHDLFNPGMKLDFCQIIVELISSVGDPKLLRVSCWALAKLFMGISPKRLHLGNQSSVEPTNFARLNSSKSIIRFAFEKLLAAESINDCVFLESLLNVNIHLPRVNWSSVLERLINMFPDLKSLALKFAAKHAFISESSSLAIYFSKNIPSFANQSLSFLASIEGIGNLLLLAGFSKTEDFSFSPLISHTECIENLKSILSNTLQNDNLTIKVDLSKSLRTCFIDWKYPKLLGEELILQTKMLFEDWLFKCSSNLSPDEIIFIRNIAAVCSKTEFSAIRKNQLTTAWIWYAFCLPYSTNKVITLLQDCFRTQSPDILFAGSSALKTYLGGKKREAIESFLINVLDALICISSEQNESVINMWNYGVLNVLHSLVNYPKYTLEYDDILGWSRDEATFLGKEIIWNFSAYDDFSEDFKSKVL